MSTRSQISVFDVVLREKIESISFHVVHAEGASPEKRSVRGWRSPGLAVAKLFNMACRS